MREFIVEADGGSRGNPGPAGYGCVVRDAATGEPLAERAEFIGVATNNVAEYRGLLAGLCAAHELDPTGRVHVRMDSKLVVEQMSGRWKIKHPDMKPLAMRAAAVFPAARVTYEWIPRERNKHADRLANEAMDAGSRGERWSASRPAGEPGTPAVTVPEPSGPPGDARAGAARARAALAAGGGPAPWGAGEGAVTAGVAAGVAAAGPGTPGTPGTPGGAGAPDGPRTPGGAGTPDGSGTPGGPRTPGGAVPGPAAGMPGDARAGAAPAGTSGSGSVRPSVVARGERVPVERAHVERVPVEDAPVEDAPVESARADVRAARHVASVPPDLGAPTTFVLLRHGETPLTPLKRFSGSDGGDPALSDTGRRQAERVAAALAVRGTVQAVVSSPLARCRETAGIVAARLGLAVSVEDGLRETGFGAWEGLTFAEVRERYPDDMNAWLADPEAAPTGGGESFAAVARRVSAARDDLIAAHAGRTVLLVSHVTPIKTLVRLVLGAPQEALFRMELSAASLTAVAYYADGNASLRLLNDTSHLR